MARASVPKDNINFFIGDFLLVDRLGATMQVFVERAVPHSVQIYGRAPLLFRYPIKQNL
jgi:hypothetical protein